MTLTITKPALAAMSTAAKTANNRTVLSETSL